MTSSARASAHACLRAYPSHWTPALLRASVPDLALIPRTRAPLFPLPAHAVGETTRAARPFSRCVPPLVAALVTGVGAAAIAHLSPALDIKSAALDVAGAVFGVLGVGCSLLGVISFRRARTTVNPLQPEAATTLVVSGVYRFTRNPMYLGFLLGLLSEMAWLGHPGALIVVPAFVFYLNRGQIAAEERALRARFGAEFTAYTTRVPRWL